MDTPVRYKCQKDVNLRKGPEVVEWLEGKRILSNYAGALKVGDYRLIYTTVNQPNGQKWGAVTEPDANGKAIWVCIKTTNVVFMVESEAATTQPAPQPVPSTDLAVTVGRHEAEIAQLRRELDVLKAK